MAIDTSIYQAFAPRQQSALDYAQGFTGLETARQANEAGALNQQFNKAKFAEYQRGVEKQTALEQLMGSMAGKSDADVLQGLRGAGRFNEAGAFEKGILERDAKRGDIAKDAATTQKTINEAQADALKRYRGALDFVDTPQGAQRWLQAQYADPLLAQHMQSMGPVEQAMARIPQTPQEFAQWRQQAGMGMEKFVADRTTGERNAQIARNDLIGPDGQINQPLLTAKRQIARESASNISMGLGSPISVQGPNGEPMLVQPPNKANGKAQVVTIDGIPVKPTSGDKPLAPAALKQLTEARDNASTMTALASTFKDDFASKGVLGVGADLSLATKGVLGTDGDSVEWWKNYRKQSELVERHALFGAALTPTELASWRSADISPGMDKATIKRNLDTRARLTQKVLETTQQDLIDAGQPAARVNPIAARKGAAEKATNAASLPSADAIAAELARRAAGGK